MEKARCEVESDDLLARSAEVVTKADCRMVGSAARVLSERGGEKVRWGG